MGKTESWAFSGFIGEDLSCRASPPFMASPPIMEEEKIEESPRALPELTSSEYSYVSYLESLGPRSGEE